MQIYAEHSSKCLTLQEELSRLAEGLGKHWDLTLDHVERVKWYAPHIRHVVLDVRCSATPVPADLTAAHARLASQVPGYPQRKLRHLFTLVQSLSCTNPHPGIPMRFASQVRKMVYRHSS